MISRPRRPAKPSFYRTRCTCVGHTRTARQKVAVRVVGFALRGNKLERLLVLRLGEAGIDTRIFQGGQDVGDCNLVCTGNCDTDLALLDVGF